jgi:hypothetical protein
VGSTGDAERIPNLTDQVVTLVISVARDIVIHDGNRQGLPVLLEEAALADAMRTAVCAANDEIVGAEENNRVYYGDDAAQSAPKQTYFYASQAAAALVANFSEILPGMAPSLGDGERSLGATSYAHWWAFTLASYLAKIPESSSKNREDLTKRFLKMLGDISRLNGLHQQSIIATLRWCLQSMEAEVVDAVGGAVAPPVDVLVGAVVPPVDAVGGAVVPPVGAVGGAVAPPVDAVGGAVGSSAQGPRAPVSTTVKSGRGGRRYLFRRGQLAAFRGCPPEKGKADKRPLLGFWSSVNALRAIASFAALALLTTTGLLIREGNQHQGNHEPIVVKQAPVAAVGAPAPLPQTFAAPILDQASLQLFGYPDNGWLDQGVQAVPSYPAQHPVNVDVGKTFIVEIRVTRKSGDVPDPAEKFFLGFWTSALLKPLADQTTRRLPYGDEVRVDALSVKPDTVITDLLDKSVPTVYKVPVVAIPQMETDRRAEEEYNCGFNTTQVVNVLFASSSHPLPVVTTLPVSVRRDVGCK